MVEDTAVDWPSLVSNHRNVADVDGIFDILGHPKRREVIRLLADLPEENEVELHNLSRAVACIVYDVSYKELEHWQYSQIRQNLRKHGLVTMSIANIIDYDHAEQTVRRGPSFAPAARVLQLVDQRDWPGAVRHGRGTRHRCLPDL